MSSSPAPLGTLTSGLDALLHSAAFAPIENVGWLRVTGSDRVRWLNGMVTNNITALNPGEGNYNFFLNAQGRIQGDATIFLDPQPADEVPRDPNCLWIRTDLQQRDKLLAMLDHFIIMDDVELHVDDQITGLLIAGPKAAELINSLGWSPIPENPMRMVSHRNPGDDLIHAHSPVTPIYEIWAMPANIRHLLDTLRKLDSGIPEATPEDLEHLRILSGTPLYGQDIRDKDLPQETNQTRALNFAKGCYLGQEIVERIRSRGAVHRTFTGFTLTGELPPAGAPLTVDAKPIGELTSVARIGDRTLALGYIRREFLTRPTSIQYPGGTATPTELPFPL